jgi:hypothetical protein
MRCCSSLYWPLADMGVDVGLLIPQSPPAAQVETRFEFFIYVLFVARRIGSGTVRLQRDGEAES